MAKIFYICQIAIFATILFGAYHDGLSKQQVSVKNTTTFSHFLSPQIDAASIRFLYIPKLSLFLPISIAPLIDDEWKINEAKTAFYGEKSSLPGMPGTTVIFAHAKKGLFATLPRLTKDDVVSILTDSQVFVYKIKESQVIAPEEVSFLRKHGDNTVVLFTCSGQNDTKRIVLFGNLFTTLAIPVPNYNLYQI